MKKYIYIYICKYEKVRECCNKLFTCKCQKHTTKKLNMLNIPIVFKVHQRYLKVYCKK